MTNANYFIQIIGEIGTVITGTPTSFVTTPSSCYYACNNQLCPKPEKNCCNDSDTDSNCNYWRNRCDTD